MRDDPGNLRVGRSPLDTTLPGFVKPCLRYSSGKIGLLTDRKRISNRRSRQDFERNVICAVDPGMHPMVVMQYRALR